VVSNTTRATKRKGPVFSLDPFSRLRDMAETGTNDGLIRPARATGLSLTSKARSTYYWIRVF
jgi:hypothetical protein